MRGSGKAKIDPEAGITECIDLSTTAARYSDLLSAVAACCDRLVDPAIRVEAVRNRLARLTGSIVGGSFIGATALALTLPGLTGPAGILAAVSATLAVCWLAALSVASGKLEKVAAIGALAVVAVALPALVMLSGGLGSPLALLFGALIFEPAWIMRTRRAVQLGALALISSLGLVAASASIAGLPTAAPPFWLWLPALLYIATIGIRIAKPAPAVNASNSFDLAAVIDGVTLRFLGNGDVAAASGQANDVIGIPPELLLGTGLMERLHVADRVAYLCALADMRDGAKSKRIETRLRLPVKQGGEAAAHLLFEITFYAGTCETGEFYALLRIANDVEVLRRKLVVEEDRNTDLNAAKNKLLASVSHELRTPLNAIIGFSDMLLLELYGPLRGERQREHVELIRDAGNHLLGVVNSILDVSKMASGAHSIAVEPFKFRDAVDMCRSLMIGNADAKQVELCVNIAEDVGELHADSRAVQQMLINLVSNAIKFTPAGGRVMIGANKAGSRLQFWVSDTGIGIAEADIDRLGEPFTQVRNDYTRQFDGAGLGLSLVKGLVGLHGGAMSIESAVGDGTTVLITLPIEGPKQVVEKQGRLVSLDEKRAKEGRNGNLRKTA